ncbi:glycogen synthase [Streptomyces prasinopilosus]|uniref:Glycogen synthase n=1 Tax=Streptomyces prasinopilosus TaxID=67344 RepID=A0A1G6M2F0_9ACTN|nr:glycogen/starch synthase [Streptomyces prasinopilosus]SDC49659.1 starch synthase [Streptomyces prasinopilosus]
MRCLYLTQELAPHFTEGGLGQASRALPAALHRGHGIVHDLFLPYYPRLVRERGLRTEPVSELPSTTVGGVTAQPVVHRLLGTGDGPEVFLLRADEWYDREGIYRDGRYVEFTDAAERAAFYGLCGARWAWSSGRAYDLVHGNDWQSGAALAHLRARRGTVASPALLLNIHSAHYWGEFEPERLSHLGLPETYAEELALRCAGRPSLLHLGMLAADAATTGSPGYARELTDDLACTPLAEALGTLELTGIVAGVDAGVWDPTARGRSSAPYDSASVEEGKRANKRALQRRLGLTVDLDMPLFGVCTRLVDEKGSDLLLEGLRPLLAAGRAQLVVVGPGDDRYRAALAALVTAAPDAVHHSPAFDQDLAWQVYAGADFSPMPSRVEPCGLNQLISMAYGTIPLTTPVGGLRDTVTDLTADPRRGTGLVIAEHTARAVQDTAERALRLLAGDRGHLISLRRRLMTQDWSWDRTARATAALYTGLAAAVRRPRQLLTVHFEEQAS